MKKIERVADKVLAQTACAFRPINMKDFQATWSGVWDLWRGLGAQLGLRSHEP